MLARRRRQLVSALGLAAALAACAAALATAQAPAGVRPAGELGVARIWHGRTPIAKADAYARYMYEHDFPKMRALAGNLGIQMLRRDEGAETDFVVISYWTSREAIRAWAGDDIELARYDDTERAFLVALEPRVRHYDILVADGRTSR
jgi:heme-degrading monooxygenase HmoA